MAQRDESATAAERKEKSARVIQFLKRVACHNAYTVYIKVWHLGKMTDAASWHQVAQLFSFYIDTIIQPICIRTIVLYYSGRRPFRELYVRTKFFLFIFNFPGRTARLMDNALTVKSHTAKRCIHIYKAVCNSFISVQPLLTLSTTSRTRTGTEAFSFKLLVCCGGC